MAEQAASLINKKQKWPLKILYAGHVRSGSASLSVALNKLGYGPVFHFITSSPADTDFAWDWFCDNLPKIDNGETVDWDGFFSQTKVYSALDAPLYIYWEQIFKQYPNIKVIINVRDTFDTWYKSVTYLYHNIIYEPYWWKCISFFNNIHKIIYHGVNPDTKWRIVKPRIVRDYGGWDVFLNNKDFAEQKFNERIEYIKSIVPKQQLLVFNVKQGWQPLCEFLDIDKDKIPTEPFPHINNSSSLTNLVKNYRRASVKKFILYRLLPVIILFVFVIIRKRRRS